MLYFLVEEIIAAGTPGACLLGWSTDSGEELTMVTDNTLWNSPPRAKEDDAEKQRKEREEDQSLMQAIAQYDSAKIKNELEKYESNLSDLKAFATLLS